MTDLSPSALQTRQLILEAGIKLFKQQGYDATTVEDIASTADVSLEITHRYFARKEDIGMALYHIHVNHLTEYMNTLPTGQLADRYNLVLEYTISDLTPQRTAMMALFGKAMHPESGLSLLGTDNNPLSVQLSEGYRQLILGSDDALHDEKATQLGIVLYTFHMLIVLFWLYDRSPDQQATEKLRHFVCELFKTIRPLFILPMIPQAIAKLAVIILPPSNHNHDPAD